MGPDGADDGNLGFGVVGFFRAMRVASPTPEFVALNARAVRFGVALILLGLAGMVLSGVAHWFALRRLQRQEVPALSRWPLSIAVAMLLAVIGLVSLWGLFSR